MVITPDVTVFMPPFKAGDRQCLHLERGVVISEWEGAAWIYDLAPTISDFFTIAKRRWEIIKKYGI